MVLISDLQSPICGSLQTLGYAATRGSESHLSGTIWLDIAMTAFPHFTRFGRCYGYDTTSRGPVRTAALLTYKVLAIPPLVSFASRNSWQKLPASYSAPFP